MVLLGNLGGGPPNDFQGEFTAQGGKGQDLLWDYAENVYAFKPNFKSFETISP